MIIAPTIANNSIIPVIRSHIEKLEYIILPILEISVVSAKVPSHVLLVTNNILPLLKYLKLLSKSVFIIYE
jgi:hypothetical protein